MRWVRGLHWLSMLVILFCIHRSLLSIVDVLLAILQKMD